MDYGKELILAVSSLNAIVRHALRSAPLPKILCCVGSGTLVREGLKANIAEDLHHSYNITKHRGSLLYFSVFATRRRSIGIDACQLHRLHLSTCLNVRHVLNVICKNICI